MIPEAGGSRTPSVRAATAPPSVVSAGVSAAATADWCNLNPEAQVRRVNTAALAEPLPDLPGGSFPLKAPSEAYTSLEEQDLYDFDTASFGDASSVAGSQASSVQSNA